jgi:hypothetical protein
VNDCDELEIKAAGKCLYEGLVRVICVCTTVGVKKLNPKMVKEIVRRL